MINNWLSITPHADERLDSNPTHYYIEWGGQKITDDLDISVGTLNWDKKYPKKSTSDHNDLDTLMSEIQQTLLSLPEDKQNILIHIHGLWGNKHPFFGEMTQALDEHVLCDMSSPYGVIVSIVWDAGFIYNHSRDVAYEKGKRSVPIIKKLKSFVSGGEGKLSIINHSMGNRVFNGIIDNIGLIEQSEPIFDKCFMVAADIENTVFEKGQPYEHANKIAKDIIVYRHNTDRTLGMSRLINNDRLGLNGITNYETMPDNITVVDVSLLNDEEFPAAKISRHRYYYTSPTVRKDILAEVLDTPSSEIFNRQKMERKNHYKLIFPED